MNSSSDNENSKKSTKSSNILSSLTRGRHGRENKTTNQNDRNSKAKSADPMYSRYDIEPNAKKDISLETILDDLDKIKELNEVGTKIELKDKIKSYISSESFSLYNEYLKLALQIESEINCPIEESTLGTTLLHLTLLHDKLEKPAEDHSDIFDSFIKKIDEGIIKLRLVQNDRKIKSTNRSWIKTDTNKTWWTEDKVTGEKIRNIPPKKVADDTKKDTNNHPKLEIEKKHVAEHPHNDNKASKERLSANIISAEAESYARKKLSSDENFKAALKISRENLTAQDGIEKTRLTIQKQFSLSPENALKITHLMRIYIDAKNCFNPNTRDGEKSPYEKLQSTITDASEDLFNETTFKKYLSTEFFSTGSTPKEYSIAMAKISIASGINDADNKKQWKKFPAKKIISESPQISEDVIKERNRIMITDNIANLYSLAKSITLAEGEKTKKEVSSRNNQLLNETLYNTLDLNSHSYYAELMEEVYSQYEEEIRIEKTDTATARKSIELLIERIKQIYEIESPEDLLINNIIKLSKQIHTWKGNREIEEMGETAIKNLMNQIKNTVWLMHISHVSLLTIIQNENITTDIQKIILRSLIKKEDREVQYEFLKQLHTNYIDKDKDRINGACELCFKLNYDPADIISKIPYAHAILEHANASELTPETLLKLAGCFTPQIAKEIINKNTAISYEQKQMVLQIIEKAEKNNENELTEKRVSNSINELRAKLKQSVSEQSSNPEVIKILLGSENESKIFEELINVLNELKELDAVITGKKYVRSQMTTSFRPSRMRSSGAYSWAISGESKALSDAEKMRSEMMNDAVDILEMLLKIKAESAIQAIDQLVNIAKTGNVPIIHEKTIAQIFALLEDDNSKITFAKHFFNMHYTANMKQELVDSYINNLAQSEKSRAQAFEIFCLSRLQDDLEEEKPSSTSDKKTSLALALLSSQNMRNWILDDNRSVEFQSLMTTILPTLTNINFISKISSSETHPRSAFSNWTKDDFVKAIKQSKPEHVWHLQWAMLANSKAAKEALDDSLLMDKCFQLIDEKLKNKSLDPSYIKALDKRVRMAYLNHLTSWEDDKKILGGEPIDLIRLREVANAFTDDFTPTEINATSSETLLLASFNEKNIKTVIDAITNNEQKSDDNKIAPATARKNRRAGWFLLQELCTEEFLSKDKMNLDDDGWFQLFRGDTAASYRHQVIGESVLKYTGDDGYKLTFNKFLENEFKDTVRAGEFGRQSTLPAFKAILCMPNIVKILDGNKVGSSATREVTSTLTTYFRLTNEVHKGFSSSNLLDVIRANENVYAPADLKSEPDSKHDDIAQEPTENIILQYIPTFLEHRNFTDEEIDSIVKLHQEYSSQKKIKEEISEIKTVQDHPTIKAIFENKIISVELKNKITQKIIANDTALFDIFLKTSVPDYKPKAPRLKTFMKDLLKSAGLVFSVLAAKSLYDKIVNNLNPFDWFRKKEESWWKTPAILLAGALGGAGIGGATAATLGTILIAAAVGAIGLVAIAVIGRAMVNKYKSATGEQASAEELSKDMFKTLEEAFQNDPSLLDKILLDKANREHLGRILAHCTDHKVKINESKLERDIKDRLTLLKDYQTRSNTSIFFRPGAPFITSRYDRMIRKANERVYGLEDTSLKSRRKGPKIVTQRNALVEEGPETQNNLLKKVGWPKGTHVDPRDTDTPSANPVASATHVTPTPANIAEAKKDAHGHENKKKHGRGKK